MFTCQFKDRTGTLPAEETTPLFRYKNPLSELNDDDKKKIKQNETKALLAQALYGNAQTDVLISLADLKITDYFPFAFPELAMVLHHRPSHHMIFSMVLEMILIIS